LQTIVEGLRRAIAAARFVVTVNAGDSGYTLSITCDPLAAPSEGTASIVIRPLSLPTGQQVTAGAAVSLTFGPMSLESVTPFIVIEIVARRQGTVVQDACVIRAELVGEPTGRADHLLASLLASRRDVLRYLLFLLADAGGAAPGGWFGAFQRAVERSAPTGHADGIIEMPLLETLVRTAARDPLKLASVQRLVNALGRTDEGRALLPEGFAALGELVAAQAAAWGATAVGGMTMGADPIACAALAGGFRGKAFFVRKEVKAHGLSRRIEGPTLDAADRCTVVEDVVSTGGSTLAAIAALREAGHEICGVISVLDRLMGGGEAIEAAAGAPYVALSTIDDVYPERPLQ